MHALPDRILWVDLETTGNRPGDEIIELGAILTNASLDEISDYTSVFTTDVPIGGLDPVVLEMHTKNGLWKDVLGAKLLAADPKVEQGIFAWLARYGGVPAGRSLPLAGSGVCHFDRRYIEVAWPNLANRLTYWSLDVGSVRRMAQLADYAPELHYEGKTHRALDDIRQHLTEAREYLAVLRDA